MNGTHYKLSLLIATRGNRGKKTMCKPGAGGGGGGSPETNLPAPGSWTSPTPDCEK